MPAHLVAAIFLGWGFYRSYEWFKTKNRLPLPILLMITVALAIFLPLFNIKNNWLPMDRSELYTPDDAARNILANIEDGSILIFQTGSVSAVHYEQVIAGNKPNVIALHNSLWAPWMRENLERYRSRGLYIPSMTINPEKLRDLKARDPFAQKYIADFVRGNVEKFNIYFLMPEDIEGIKFIPWGFVYKASLKDEPADPANWKFSFRTSRFCSLALPTPPNWSWKKCVESNMEIDNGRGFIEPKDAQKQAYDQFEEVRAGYAASYKNLADGYLARRDFDNAIKYYGRTINLLGSHFTEEQKLNAYLQKGAALLNAERGAEALSFADEVNKKFPKSKETAWFLAATLEKNNRKQEAMNLLFDALREYPKDENLNNLLNKLIESTNKKSPAAGF